MSSKSQSVDHAGVTWKFVPGSRREQVLKRMIQQDDALHHRNVEPLPDDGLENWLLPGLGGLLVGFSFGVVACWLT